jgi:hypothetical protein
MIVPCIGDIVDNNLVFREVEDGYNPIPTNNYEKYIHPELKIKLGKLLAYVDTDDIIKSATLLTRGLIGIQAFDDYNIPTTTFILMKFLEKNGIKHKIDVTKCKDMLATIFTKDKNNNLIPKFDRNDLELHCIGDCIVGWTYNPSIEWTKLSLKESALNKNDEVYKEIYNFISQCIIKA